jgi:hypothetical protein
MSLPPDEEKFYTKGAEEVQEEADLVSTLKKHVK